MSNAAAVSPPRISGFNYVRPLGSGGFAHVFQYEQDLPRRVVAVKVLTDGTESEGGTVIGAHGGSRGTASAMRRLVGSYTMRAAFDAEADAMARLSSHPSIVSIFQASVASDGRPYIAMEFCPSSFRDRSRGNPIELSEVLDAGVRLAGALETAHQSGILHRDIKPSNVLVATTGRPVLADFGIVSLRGQMRGEGTSEAMSIPWAAPEVIDRETSGTIASEVWSFGATLYTFAAGRSPFARPDGGKDTRKAMSERIRRAVYVPVPGAQGYAPFDQVISRALSKNPADRFASMREFGEALQLLQRRYGYNVTPMDVVSSEWVPPSSTSPSARGPVISSVQAEGRAQRRAEAAARRAAGLNQRGTDRGEPGSFAWKPVLIGAGTGLVVLGVGAAVFMMLGGG